MVKMRDWPTESKATDSSLVEPDRTAGRELSLTTKRETTVRKADQLIIYFGLLFSMHEILPCLCSVAKEMQRLRHTVKI